MFSLRIATNCSRHLGQRQYVVAAPQFAKVSSWGSFQTLGAADPVVTLPVPVVKVQSKIKPFSNCSMQDQRWKAAFEIIEKLQSLPLSDRRAGAESLTDDPSTLNLVAELLQEEARELDSDSSEPALKDRFGKYEITAKLGRGGSGSVYAAIDLELNRPVALKFLSNEMLVQGKRVTDLLIREASAASAINHPNIVTIYDVMRQGDSAGRTAIVMELIEGVSLGQMRTPEVASIVRWGIQMASGLASAHALGIVHRDIKPDNLMVRNSDDGIKILDFGIARRSMLGTESNRSLAVGGSIDYYSPEQVDAKRPTAATDIFSMGIVLYELVTGRHPFAGETPLDKLHAIREKPHTPAVKLNPNADKEISDLLDAMLAKDPVSRPSAAEVEQRLLRTLAPQVRRNIFRSKAWIAAVLALTLGAGGYAAYSLQNTMRERIDSVAVLTLQESKANLKYLSEGLRHEIAAGLATVPGLRVAGTTNLNRYAGKDLREAGTALGVQTVVSGKVDRSTDGKTILLDIELADSRNGEKLWTGHFEQPDKGLSTFSREISGRIAAKLGARFTSSALNQQRNPDAYETYLRARYHYNKRTKADMAIASSLGEAAVQMDPRFAEAWTLIAASQGFTPGMYNTLSPKELLAKTRHAIDRAIEINPNLPEVHAVLGGVKIFQERDWAGAEAELTRAIALNPNDGQSHFFSALVMRMQGRQKEERAFILRARELDPLSPVIANHVAWTEYFRGDDESAGRALDTALAVDPTFSSNYTLRGYILLRKRQYPEAIQAFRKATETASGATSLADLGYAYAVSGDKAAAQAVLKALENKRDRFVPSGALAWIHLGLGDKDAAFAGFAKACDENFHWLNYVNIWQVYEPLRDDPRMATITHRLKLDGVKR
jgi:Flp pilus assembly protein TadD/TolB-like protein